jgi:hypothetical protein
MKLFENDAVENADDLFLKKQKLHTSKVKLFQETTALTLTQNRNKNET